MARELGVFPYSADNELAPNTDGTLTSVPSNVNYDVPSPTMAREGMKNNGTIIKGNIGNTDYLVTNMVAHGVLAGDS
jgi:hypothetical protein